MSNYKTSNQQYGASQSMSSSVKKQRIGSSTLQYLKQTDSNGFLHQQQNIAQRIRHGLFTQPLNLATGDIYKDKPPQKVQKNIKVNGKLQAKVGPQLFEKMGSTNIGDIYKDPFKEGQLYLKEKNDLSIHPTAFLAGGKQKKVNHSEFEHLQSQNHKVYDTRDQNGQVKTGKKNFYTNSMKKGNGNTTVGHLFGTYKYMGSDFDNAKQMQKQERMVHKAKILQPFSGASKPGQTFTPNYEAYGGQKEPYKPIDEDASCRSKTTGKWNYNNPNKKGFYGTFQQFPNYIEEGEKTKIPSKSIEKPWKPNYNGTSKAIQETQTRPCPPASHMPLNEARRLKA